MTPEKTPHQVSIEKLAQLIVSPVRRSAPVKRWYVRVPATDKWSSRRMCKTHWRLRLVLDGDSQQMMAIELRGDAVIGAQLNPDDDLDIRLNRWDGCEQGVSRRHLLLCPTDNGILAADLDSTNGSMLNGMPMAAGQAYSLSSGDLLTLGSLHLRIRNLQKVDCQPSSARVENHAWGQAQQPALHPAV